MTKLLDGRAAIVTGGASPRGLGLATADDHLREACVRAGVGVVT